MLCLPVFSRSDNVISDIPSGLQIFYKQSSCFNLPPPVSPPSSFHFLLLYKLLLVSTATQTQWSIISFCLEIFWCNGAVLPKLFKIFSVSLQTDCHPKPKASLQPVSLCICSVVSEGGICCTMGSNI